MKISNETKVGALTAVAITILILGFSFLKGNKLFSSSETYYAEYANVSGLTTADDVLLKGLQVGKVTSIELKTVTGTGLETDPLVTVVVGFILTEDLILPKDSEARIVSSDLLGDKALELILGNSPVPAEPGSFIAGNVEPSIQQAITVELLPVKNKFEELIKNIDSVITTIQATFDTRFQDDIEENMVSIRETLNNVNSTSLKLDNLVERESAKIDDIFSNIRSITATLEENEEAIARTIQNVEAISDSISKVKFTETMMKVNAAVTDFALIMEEARTGEGNIALLLNQRDIYDNLRDASKSLDLLVEDMRRNPRKFLPPLIRIGGGKNNGGTNDQ